MVDNPRWAASVVGGSSYKLGAGHAGTQLAPGSHRPEFYSGDTTVIIGVDSSAPSGRPKASKVSWLIPTSRPLLASNKRSFLAVGCRRYFGGLHSRTYDRGANIFLNGSAIERINLRIRPDLHSDYFHRMPLPEQFPDIGPFSECSTVYAWAIPTRRLNSHTTYQQVTIELEPNVTWDVDYVGLLYQAPHRIFISYSRKDSRVATTIRNKLSQLGVPTWIDTQEINIGDSLIRKIERALEDVEYVFALLSRNSIRSSWVQKELEVALTHEVNGHLTTVIPILLDDCEIPGFLRSKAYADLRKPRNYPKVMCQIESLLSRQNKR